MLRFQRASELLDELHPILATTRQAAERPSRPSFAEVSARTSTSSPSTIERRALVERRFPTLTVAALSAVGLLVAIGLVSRGGDTPPERVDTPQAAPARSDERTPHAPADSSHTVSMSAPVAVGTSAEAPPSVPAPDARPASLALAKGAPAPKPAKAPAPPPAAPPPSPAAPSPVSSAPTQAPADEPPDPTKVR